jgi:hypothetical protein
MLITDSGTYEKTKSKVQQKAKAHAQEKLAVASSLWNASSGTPFDQRKT